MEILDLLKIGMNWGVAGVLALFFAHHAIKRTMRLESRLNAVEDFRAEEMVAIIESNTESNREVANAINENAAAIDKLRTHCMITTKRQEVRT